MTACAWRRRSIAERLGSPKCPMPKIVVPTTVIDTMTRPAAPTQGGQRAASHKNIGNSNAVGIEVFHGASGKKTTNAVIAPSTASAAVPSRYSLRLGGLRVATPILMIKGATATMPTKSEANQFHQMSGVATSGL